MAESDVRVPAGWYPDPLGLPQLRWWDNHAWTEYTSDARQPMVAHETVTAQPRLAYADDDEDLLTRRERRERERSVDSAEAPANDADGVTATPEAAKPSAEALLSLEAPVKETVAKEEDLLSPAAMFADVVPTDAPTTPAYNLDTRFDDLLGEPQGPVSAFAHVSESTTTFVPESLPIPQAAPAAPAATAHHGDLSASSGAAWAIAFMPVFTLLLGMFFLLSGLAGDLSTVFAVVLLVLPYAATVLLAYLDRKTLLRKGHEHPAHWALAFAGAPIYLIARFASVVRRSGRGFGPLVSWGGLAALTAAAVVAVPGLVISLAPANFSADAEAGIVSQAQTLGREIAVQCPDTPPTIVGQTFQCIAKTVGSDPVSWSITVALQRANGWIGFSVVDWGVFTTFEN